MADVLRPIVKAGGTTALTGTVDAARIASLTFDRPSMISVFVALDDTNKVVGFQWLERHPDLPPDIGDVATFAQMNPKIPGVGRALFQQTRTAAKAAGLSRIAAVIRADNTGGLAFYGKMGFTDHERLDGMTLADGTPVSKIIKHFVL